MTQQRLEAEEAKAKLKYTLREAKLKKEQASIKAELEILGAQKEAAIAEARLRILESVQNCISVSSVADPVDQSEEPMERAKKSVEQMNQQTLAPMKKQVMESTQLYISWRGGGWTEILVL